MDYTELKPLTEDERSVARTMADADAVQAALGKRPARADYADSTISRYPRWLTATVAAMLLVVLFAAANVSMFRLFTAGRDHFVESINVGWQAALVGMSAVLLAEFMVMVSTIAMSIFYEPDNRWRWLMLLPICVGLAMALIGNWTITRPATMWGWLETLSPPVALLFMGVISERLALSEMARRHSNEAAYQEALADYTEQAANPRELAGWRAAYMRRLKEAIQATNRKGRGKSERIALMAQLTSAQWLELVQRELAEDAVWELAAANPTQPEVMVESSPRRLEGRSGSGWLPEYQPTSKNE